METILGALPLIKVLASFVLMLVGIRFKFGIGLSIAAGSLLLAFLFGHGPVDWLQSAMVAVTGEKALFLAAIIALILLLSGCMDKSGQAGRLMEAMSGMLRGPRLRLVFFPALIGLLPMPGGAIFSAPMVEQASKGMGLSPERKVALNYWFRHIWEMCWPLYPGLILLAALSDRTLGQVVGLLWPGTLICIAVGYAFYLLGGDFPAPQKGGERNVGKALREGLPLLVAIVGAIVLETAMANLLPGVPFEWGVVTALAAAVLCAAVQNGFGPAKLAKLLFGKGVANLVLVVFAVFIYKEILENCGAVGQIASMAGGGLALFAAAVFLPFLVGFISGITIAFVGASFPLLLDLLPRMGLEAQAPAYIALAMFFGFTGVLFSPIHICFVLTCEYFHADFGKSWRMLILPCTAFALLGVGYWWWLL